MHFKIIIILLNRFDHVINPFTIDILPNPESHAMKNPVFFLIGFITFLNCKAQQDNFGINLGLELFVFDQAKVANEYLPSLFPEKVIQMNFLPQINYAFPGKSEVGMYLGYGQRKINNSSDATQTDEIKTISVLAGLFYQYKFIRLDRFNAYGQSSLQIQLNHQQYKQLTTAYTEFETMSVLQQEREIYSVDVNLRIGAEYRLVRGLYLNVFLGNDIISYNWLPEQFTTYVSNSSFPAGQTIQFLPDPLQSENFVYSTGPVSRWVFFKDCIIFGGGLKYQF